MVFKKQVSSTLDTGWGVIFRLNDLFREVESLCSAGRYNDWNYKLDRIWTNLCYRNHLVIKKDPDGNIIEMEYSRDDIEEKNFLDLKISNAKSLLKKLKKKFGANYINNKEYLLAKRDLYDCLMLKENWLRKLMHDLDLYLKEIESNPAKAMWGR
jgi:hypothetical protein